MSGRRKTILDHDDRDGRRELLRLFGDAKLGEKGRLAFVRWCKSRSGAPADTVVGPAYPAAGYTISEAMADVAALSLQYRLSIDEALVELTRRVRRL